MIVFGVGPTEREAAIKSLKRTSSQRATKGLGNSIHSAFSPTHGKNVGMDAAGSVQHFLRIHVLNTIEFACIKTDGVFKRTFWASY